jgi:hypothetical protein
MNMVSLLLSVIQGLSGLPYAKTSSSIKSKASKGIKIPMEALYQHLPKGGHPIIPLSREK